MLAGDAAAQVGGAAVQAGILAVQARTAAPLGAALLPAALLLAHASLLLLIRARPKAYGRCRNWLLPLALAAVTLLPHRRGAPGEAGLGRLLARPPSASSLGAVWDVLRAAAGTGALGAALWSCSVVLPPLAALLLHATTTLLTWAPAHCSAALLAAPLARQRQVALARALELGSLPLAAVQPIALQLPAALSDSHAVCVATTAWLHVTTGLIAPLLFIVWLWPPPPPVRHAAGVPLGPRQWASSAAAACDRQVHWALGGAARPLARAALAYFLAANCWLLLSP